MFRGFESHALRTPLNEDAILSQRPTREQRQATRLQKRRALARHGITPRQGVARAVTGILVKAIAVVAGAAIAITGISTYEIAQQLKANGIVLTDANGKPFAANAADLKGPINMLLVGSDTRSGSDPRIFGNETSTLADVIILLHVSADRQNAVALSFPRDLLVPWPACPSNTGGPGYYAQSLGQINATIANGGPTCTLLTVEKLTGVKIPYLAMINFGGVIEMSNAIGGVRVCIAKDIKDPYTFLNLKKGWQTLQGMQALQFLRTRHGVGDGSDLGRISNQQVFLTSLIRKVRSKGVLTNPVTLYSLANAAARNMKLSTNLTDLNTLVGIASAVKNTPLEKITFLQVPSHGGLPKPYSGRVMPNYDTANVLFEKLRKDEPIILSKVNTGFGTTTLPSASPSASPQASATTKASPKASASPSPSESALPDGYTGTNGSTVSCSG